MFWEEFSVRLSISFCFIRRFSEPANGTKGSPAPAMPAQSKKEICKMKFMMIVKHKENYGFPPKELMEEIGKLGEEAVKKGTMLGNGGLLPTSAGASVRLTNGKITVTDGPFTEGKEIIGGYAQFELKSKDEAVQSAMRFMELHKKYWPGWEGETEVRQMMEPGDFGHK
jgi:hypothetical protein